MINQNDTHESLLAEWKSRPLHEGKAFFPDGIVDPERWANTERKILFINKEAHDNNDPNSKGFDLREIIRDDWDGVPKEVTYSVVATWAYALIYASADATEPYPRYDMIDREKQRESLLSSAVINIKKSGGRTSSIDQDLKKYVEEDGDLIRRQVDLIDPEIIVCGGVWYNMIQPLWPTAQKIYDDVFVADGRTFIAFWHPANHSDPQMKYYALAAFVQNSRALTRHSQ